MKLQLCIVALLLCFAFSEGKKVGDQNCVLCEFVVKSIEDFLSDNATEAEVIKVVTNICSILPKSIRSQCKQFIQQEGQAIIELLIAQESPESLCTQIGLCSSKRAPRVKDSTLCSYCKLFVQMIEGYLAQNDTKQEIIDTLEGYCQLFGPLEGQCDAFVEEYVPAIIDYLVHDQDASTVCTQELHLCDSKVTVRNHKKFARI